MVGTKKTTSKSKGARNTPTPRLKKDTERDISIQISTLEDWKSFSKALVRASIAKAGGQTALAKEFGMNRCQIIAWLKGRQSPSGFYFFAMTRYLGLSTNFEREIREINKSIEEKLAA